MAKQDSEQANNHYSLPIVLSMVVCDAVWTDPTTGKRTLLGVFNQCSAVQFPLIIPQFSVYLAMTGIRGNVRLQTRLVDAGEERPAVLVSEGVAEAPSPLSVVETAWTTGQLALPAPGDYCLQLSARGVLLLERRLSAVQVGVPAMGE